MKNLITSILLLFALSLTAQDWQLDGTKYPNATNQGDTVSLATKVPLWDADNLQNYFADLGDILALNPVPSTPTLQEVSEAGNTTSVSLRAYSLSNPNDYAEFTAGSDPRLRFGRDGGETYQMYPSPVGGNFDFVTPVANGSSTSSTKLRLINADNRISGGDTTILVARVMGRMRGEPAQSSTDYVTFGQMQDSIETPGIVEITEVGKTGYGTIYRRQNPNFYGDIGTNAIDFSFSFSGGNIYGALGDYSIVTGLDNVSESSFGVMIGGQDNEVSGSGSFATIIGGNKHTANGGRSVIIGGSLNTASGNNAIIIGGASNEALSSQSYAFGVNNTAFSFGEMVMGLNTTLYTPNSASAPDPNDRLFIIGNGTSDASTSDAFTILKNGQIGIGIDNFEANTTGELLQVEGNIEATSLILSSPDGSRWQIVVDNSGNLSTSAL